ncbi:Kdo(2)-lipid IV(A) acyltransferase [Citrobacter koseri]|uniref:Kdo(2)-lipid IV(A) acyltransferase n=1 Tax=Citrobacter koseri TaxID=545 RepID=UPI001A28598C|nr:Kdo(2)-lipid IV(A) acyltransferase [Citrobacter koseri]MDE9578477.1 LpxL/LpxP family Kdo(2)-lipid IV(A) lauroyl/palmitoleoyl acyltransferasee [Citrobacter koseri]HAT8005113.1 lipid A biosynthesis lauroyl acyltransferase [Citrobacter koseri]
MTRLPTFSFAFFHPRYWLLWLGIFFLRCAVLLPYPILLRLGACLGRVAMRALPRRVTIARRNLELCFKALPVKEREKLLIKNFESVGMGVLETGIAWFWSDRRLRKWFTVTGYEHMESARAENKGVLLIGMHFLTLELGARIFGMLNPGIGVYRPNNNALYDWLQTRGRLRSNKTMLDRYDLKGMIRVLKQGEIVWYAPDHDYGARNSVFVPFFDVPDAATTAGSYMLVRSARPAVVPFVPRRRADGRGYDLIILPDIGHELYDEGKETVATRMNRAIERAINLAPEQYMWLHRRFKTRPAGKPALYGKKENAIESNGE